MTEAPTLADYIEDFKKFLMYERNASAHTLRCYMGDLEQFYDFLCPPNAQGVRRQVSIHDIDNITIREYLATLYEKKKKKPPLPANWPRCAPFSAISAGRAFWNSTRRNSWPRRVWSASCPTT